MKNTSLTDGHHSPIKAVVPQTLSSETPLSPHLGFVVLFRSSAGQSDYIFSGRVEHLPSGRSTHFHSPNELVAFLTEVLHQCEPPQS